MRRRTASLLPNLEAVNTQLEVAAEEQGVREGEFVLALVELLLGHQLCLYLIHSTEAEVKLAIQTYADKIIPKFH